MLAIEIQNTTARELKNEIDEFSNIILKKVKNTNGTSKEALEVMKMVYNIYDNDKKIKRK